jgi:hypothetical protein
MEDIKDITFISLRPTNDIDFIRRFGECCSRWVVGDIGAALDLKAIGKFFAGHGHLTVVLAR